MRRVYMFKPRFAPLVKSGAKRHTVRPRRKRPTCVGDQVSLREWAGLPYRSKQVVLRESVCCMKAAPFEINEDGLFFVDGMYMGKAWSENFARGDGFRDKAEMVEWFRGEHGLPFRDGEIVYWD